ncbi:MAG: LysR family transcriptional regulator [Pseudomonas sp.]|uniref:LysR family transcriptional regulator n=1 Tax=Pseudomonas sp. TaxID=306 RepID=UPI003D6F4A35
MSEPDFQQLRVFMQVAQARSFTQVADSTGLSVSTISNTVRTLEKHMGLQLLTRTTRSVSVTDAGKLLIEKIAPLMEDLHSVLRSVSETANDVSGTLRLTVPSSASRLVIQPLLKRFLLQHKGIRLEVAVDNSLVDIVSHGFDAGIRYDDVLSEDMVVVPLISPMEFIVAGSPAYVAARGVPVLPEDLLNHDCINYRNAETGLLPKWDFEQSGKAVKIAVQGRVASNDTDLIIRAALDGFGFAYVARKMVEPQLNDGSLIPVLEDWSAPCTLYLYYFNRAHLPKKLRVFIDFLKQDAAAAHDQL